LIFIGLCRLQLGCPQKLFLVRSAELCCCSVYKRRVHRHRCISYSQPRAPLQACRSAAAISRRAKLSRFHPGEKSLAATLSCICLHSCVVKSITMKHQSISRWLSQLGLPQYCMVLEQEYDGVE
ncbi:hypothetical protein ATANTOWER_006736, partial [Ataeniobius toweri]|nr:hypothetical protein [Ataeniobius toweri]